MAFITVISTTNSIKVDFGTYSGSAISTGNVPKKRAFQKREITFTLVPDESMIECNTSYNKLTFPVSFDGSIGILKVDSIDGATPTTNSHLYDLLVALIA